MHLKGRNVNLLFNKESNIAATEVIAASTSCDFNLTANTSDAASKSDPGNGMWASPAFNNYSWSVSNESFIVDYKYLYTLLNEVVTGDCEVSVQFQHDSSAYGFKFAKKGVGIITSLDITAANADFVKVNISIDGSGKLTDCDPTTITPATTVADRLKGKALMVAINTADEGETANYKTIACSTSHKLSVSIQTGDTTDKDMNDAVVTKEVTGKSITLSTENLIESVQTGDPNGLGIGKIYDYLVAGKPIDIAFGYYPNSIGQDVHTASGDTGWTGGTVIISGKFICTSLSNSGSVGDDSTFSAEFQSVGSPTVATTPTEQSSSQSAG